MRLSGPKAHLPRLAALCLALLLLLACEQQEVTSETVLRPVRTLIVEASRDVAPETYVGVAKAGVESSLSFRVAGTVEKVGVKLGDRVRRGQLLARLDPTDYRLRAEEAKAGLAQARAAERQASADYDRVRSLYENNNASKAEFDAARAYAESAAAQVETGELRLAQAEQQLTYTELKSPLAGAVARVEVETNENVRSGQMVVLLASGGRPEVEVAVPESLVGRLQTGQRASIAFDALPGERFAGRVSEVGIFSRDAATFDAVIEVLDGGEEATSVDAVRSGMAAEVSFLFDRGAPTLHLPTLAIGEDTAGRFVFLLERRGDGTGVVRRQGVEVGAIDGMGVVITSGLEAGSEVVTAGVRRLADGMEVKAPAAPDPAMERGGAGAAGGSQ